MSDFEISFDNTSDSDSNNDNYSDIEAYDYKEDETILPDKTKTNLNTQENIIKPKNTIVLKPKTKIVNIETPSTPSTKTIPSKKPSVAEEHFEFNEETINFFTKDLNPKKILIKHPPHTPFLEKINDTMIICLLIKIGHFKDYHCNTSKCKVGKLWNGKPIQLILNRKNSIQNDLTISNLDLICANCYMINYGLDIFIKKKKDIILNCSWCDFPLVKFKDSRKKKGVCLACEKKMSKMSFEKQENTYFNKLTELYSENPVLSDDIKHTNYYSEVSKYKTFDSSSKNTTKSKNISHDSISQPIIPIIELNMNIPDLSDLIDDE